MTFHKDSLCMHYTKYRKTEKLRIVFLFQAASVFPSWESFYLACMEDAGIDVRLLLIKESSVEHSQMQTAESFLTENKIPYLDDNGFDLEHFNPHIAVIQFPYDLSYHTPRTLSLRFRMMGIRVLYIPYGIEISDTEIARKDHFQNFVVENSWRIYTCCEAVKEEYTKYCRNRDAVRVFGSPKFDGLSHTEDYPLSPLIREKAGHRKIILWKLHFPKRILQDGNNVLITPALDEYITFAKNMEKNDDLFFIIAPHPKMLYGTVSSDTKGDESLKEKVEEFFAIIRGKKNAFIDRSDDYRNSLYHSDAIIMDRSAVVIEAAMTGKPILFMTNSAYKEPWTEGIRQVIETLEQGSNASDMESFLERFQSGTNTGINVRSETLKRYFPYTGGKCGLAIKEDIMEGIEEEIRLKPQIAVYGLGDVCSYYFEKEGLCTQNEYEIKAVFDSNQERWGKTYFGFPVQPPKMLQKLSYDAVVVMTEQHYYDIKGKLVYELYIDERKIWRLDEFLQYINDSRGKKYGSKNQ